MPRFLTHVLRVGVLVLQLARRPQICRALFVLCHEHGLIDA